MFFLSLNQRKKFWYKICPYSLLPRVVPENYRRLKKIMEALVSVRVQRARRPLAPTPPPLREIIWRPTAREKTHFFFPLTCPKTLEKNFVLKIFIGIEGKSMLFFVQIFVRKCLPNRFILALVYEINFNRMVLAKSSTV